MQQHVKIIAIINIVLSGLGIIGGVVVLIFFGGLAGLAGADGDPDAAAGVVALGAVGVIAFIAILVWCVPTLIGGIGLMQYREWARILMIVMSAIGLLSVPLGTALGVYGIWALTRDETRALFKANNA
jgi:hypothetical protein